MYYLTIPFGIGSKCIFCKSTMITFDNVALQIRTDHAPLDFTK
ncbi:cold-shock protein [Escherichia coli]|nr:cold-shock protein [Escherichia coli]